MLTSCIGTLPRIAFQVHRNKTRLDLTRRISLTTDGYPHDFLFFPTFFSEPEQRLLLSTALSKLDHTESRHYRRKRKEYLSQRYETPVNVIDIFLPDEYYCFEEGHFDGVIKRYREMHVSSWPVDDPNLISILDRLKSVHPRQDTQTHILHLASDGEIQPHVDNVQASGTWILGVSLGNTRILRLENVKNSSDSYELALPSGSVYLQRDTTRYDYKHSILVRKEDPGQRLSIMIRDRPSDNRGIL